MQNPLDVIPGRKINDVCPSCKQGRLRPVTRNEKGDNGVIGPGGRSWNYHLVDHLACNECCACFEAEESIRGVDLKDVVLRQAQGFKNPDQSPAVCHACGSDKLTKEELRKPFRTRAVTPRGEKGPEEITFITYCLACYSVNWVDGLTTIPISMLSQFGS